MNQLLAIFLMRMGIARNKLRNLRNHSLLKIIVVWVMIIGLFAGTFYVPYRAFKFLLSMGHLGFIVIDRLLYLFFMGLFIMLIFSNCIICYATSYRAKETEFLFTMPVDYSQIFFVKLIDCIFLSSWTFLCFLLPILSAYAFVKQLGWIFYLCLIVFFIPFAIVAGALGCLITMVLIRYIPQKMYKLIGIIGVVIFLAGCFYLAIGGRGISRAENEILFLLTNFIPHFGFSQFAFSPNFWISEGIFKVIAGSFKESFFWWALLVSNALFLCYVGKVISKRIYYYGWVKSGTMRSARKFSGRGEVIDFVCKRLTFIDPKIRGLVIKDVKVFWRDPLQWSQFTVFFGLLAIYFANIRNLGYENVMPFWKNIISFLNLTATNLTLASLSVRFVFPQLSLEAKRLWILGLAPLTKKDLLVEKFWLNSTAALFISLPLIILSNYMLKVSVELMLLSILVVIVMCFSLISLCIGIGAMFPDFKEDNPAQIVSGFGGTLSLVLCLLYISISVTALAMPFHLLLTAQITELFFRKLIVFVGFFVFVLSVVISFSFLYFGNRAFKKIEL